MFLDECEPIIYLPHQGVVVVGLDFTRVDQFSLKRSEAGSFGDVAFVREDSTVRDVSPRGLENC